MSVLSSVYSEFRKRLLTITEYPIALENAKFTPVNGQTYLKAWHRPAGNSAVTVGFIDPIDDYTGFFQVSVYCPSDELVGASDIACNRVFNLFRRGTKLGCAFVTEQPEISRGDNQGGWYVRHISIYYRALAGV